MANLLNFYFEQLVTESDMDTLQANLELAEHQLMLDQGYTGVVYGFDTVEHNPVPDLTVDIAGPGVAYDQEGQRIFLSASTTLDVSTDSDGSPTTVVGGGNEKWVSVFIQFERVASDLQFDGNGLPVNFRQDEGMSFVVVQGAEAGAGLATRPGLLADALLVADILLTNGMTQIQDTDIESADTATDPDSRFEWIFNLTASSPATVRVGPLPDAMQAVLSALNTHTNNLGSAHPASALDFTNTAIHARYPNWGAAVDVQEAFDDLSDDLEQLIRTTQQGAIQYGIVSGILPTDQGVLDVQMTAGEFWYEGRLYEPTQAQINASTGTDAGGELTVTDDDTTYIGIRPTGGDITLDEDSLEVSTSLTGFPSGYCPAGVVTAASTDITVIEGVYDVLPGPLVQNRVSEVMVTIPRLEHDDFGADPSASPAFPGPHTMRWSLQAVTTDDEVVNVPLGPYGWWQQDASPAALSPTASWPEGVFPDGTALMIVVDVLGTHTTEDDVSYARRLIGRSYVSGGASVPGTWTSVFESASTQAGTDGLGTATSMGTNSGLARVQIDGGNLTSGDIIWYFDVKVMVLPQAENPIRVGDASIRP